MHLKKWSSYLKKLLLILYLFLPSIILATEPMESISIGHSETQHPFSFRLTRYDAEAVEKVSQAFRKQNTLFSIQSICHQPPEIWYHIFAYLCMDDLKKIACTCKTFRATASNLLPAISLQDYLHHLQLIAQELEEIQPQLNPLGLSDYNLLKNEDLARSNDYPLMIKLVHIANPQAHVILKKLLELGADPEIDYESTYGALTPVWSAVYKSDHELTHEISYNNLVLLLQYGANFTTKRGPGSKKKRPTPLQFSSVTKVKDLLTQAERGELIKLKSRLQLLDERFNACS